MISVYTILGREKKFTENFCQKT